MKVYGVGWLADGEEYGLAMQKGYLYASLQFAKDVLVEEYEKRTDKNLLTLSEDGMRVSSTMDVNGTCFGGVMEFEVIE